MRYFPEQASDTPIAAYNQNNIPFVRIHTITIISYEFMKMKNPIKTYPTASYYTITMTTTIIF